MLEKIAEGVYCCEAPLKVGGSEIGSRATIIQTPQGLWLHSPIGFDQKTLKQMESLGPVAYVVAPNLWHHIYLRQAKESFPQAGYYYAPRLDEKRADFPWTASVMDASPWHPHIEQILIAGMPKFMEVVFFHPASETLVVTDLIFHLTEVRGLMSTLTSKLFGTYNRPAVSRLFRSMISNKQDFKRSIQQIQSWPFKHIIMSHGKPFIGNGKEVFTELLAPYLH